MVHMAHIASSLTALEILRDTNGRVDILVAGLGTGGAITGLDETLKAHIPYIRIAAVEPSTLRCSPKPTPQPEPGNCCPAYPQRRLCTPLPRWRKGRKMWESATWPSCRTQGKEISSSPPFDLQDKKE